MEALSFFGSVWVSIIAGIFIIAMVIGCSFDRHYQEAPKWWIVALALVTFIAWQWSNLTLDMLWSSTIWANIGWYVLIGLAYSVLEFLLEVRRSARYWGKTWSSYKTAHDGHMATKRQKRADNAAKVGTEDPFSEAYDAISSETLVSDFLARHGRDSYYSKRVIGIEPTENKQSIEPKVNRSQLAESVGCWTIFWPFYAVSLIIGDFITEIFRVVADFIASISGRFVRMAFKDVFKV